MKCYWSILLLSETNKFYNALSTVGTDFSMINAIFPNRKRRELKNKFKREERRNGALVEKALRKLDTNFSYSDIDFCCFYLSNGLLIALTCLMVYWLLLFLSTVLKIWLFIWLSTSYIDNCWYLQNDILMIAVICLMTYWLLLLSVWWFIDYCSYLSDDWLIIALMFLMIYW